MRCTLRGAPDNPTIFLNTQTRGVHFKWQRKAIQNIVSKKWSVSHKRHHLLDIDMFSVLLVGAEPGVLPTNEVVVRRTRQRTVSPCARGCSLA